MFRILGRGDSISLSYGVWQKTTRTLCLFLLTHCQGGWDGQRASVLSPSLCFRGQHLSLFVLRAQLERSVCKLSSPAGRVQHTWVDVRIHTLMHEHTDAQTTLCLKYTHMRPHTQAGGESMQVGHTSKGITPHSNWSHSDSGFTWTGLISASIVYWFHFLWPSLTAAETSNRWAALPGSLRAVQCLRSLTLSVNHSQDKVLTSTDRNT